jgi:membrane-associated phospholipid phosphatase
MTIKALFYDWGGLNVALFHLINHFHASYYDQFMRVGSMAGKYKIFPVYLILIACIALWHSRHVKAGNARAYSEYRILVIRTLSILLVAWLCSLAWVLPVKNHFHLPRPFAALPEGSVHIYDDLRASEPPMSSFPSGHAIFSMLMVAGLWPLLNRNGKIAAVAYLLWVAISRISLGLHFPADILGGWILSFAALYLIQTLFIRFRLPERFYSS